MRADSLRWLLVAALAVAAVVSVVANKSHSAFVGWLGFALFLCAVALYFVWRRAALAQRRAGGTVADGGPDADEARTRADR